MDISSYFGSASTPSTSVSRQSSSSSEDNSNVESWEVLLPKRLVPLFLYTLNQGNTVGVGRRFLLAEILGGL